MTAYWVDYGLSFVDSQVSFRLPLAVQMVFAIMCLFFLPFCPESPRWLMKRGQNDKARTVLRQLSVLTGDEREEAISAEYEEIETALVNENSTTIRKADGTPVSPLRACFTNGHERYFHRVALGFGSQFMQQLCGINLIAYYAPVIFEQSVGLEHSTSLLLSGFNNIVNHGASLPAIWTIEKFGRVSVWSSVTLTNFHCRLTFPFSDHL